MRQAIKVDAFLTRLLNFEDEVIDRAEAALHRDSNVTLQDHHDDFYGKFQDGFCTEPTKQSKALRPTINVHVFLHLSEHRRRSNRQLYETSSEPFESLYGVIRKCYRAGTRNVTKQIFENVYMHEK